MARVRGDYSGIGELLRSEMMQTEMRRRAEQVKKVAEARAPVGDERDPHRGRYKASFAVTSGVLVGKTARAYGRVSNDAPEAFYVEYGTGHTPRHHTLLNALLEGAKD